MFNSLGLIPREYNMEPTSLLKKLADFNSSIVKGSYVNAREPFSFTCPCGAIVSRKWRDLLKPNAVPLCLPCSRSLKLKDQQSLSLAQIKAEILAKCSESGSTPDLSTYTNRSNPFNILCRCGAGFQRSWSSIGSAQCKALCHKCSVEARTLVRKSAEFPSVHSAILAKCQQFGSIPDLSTYSDNQTPFSITCSCGSVFQTTWNNLQKTHYRATCNQCSYKAISGPNHPNWKPEKLDADRTERHYDLRYMPWVKAVLLKHNFTCAITGARGGKLAPHHLYNWADYPELRFEVSNGVALSRELHIEFHSLYGKGNNTLEQFQEFFYIKTGATYRRQTCQTPL